MNVDALEVDGVPVSQMSSTIDSLRQEVAALKAAANNESIYDMWRSAMHGYNKLYRVKYGNTNWILFLARDLGELEKVVEKWVSKNDPGAYCRITKVELVTAEVGNIGVVEL